jgi:hypothetical protein
MPLIQGRKNAKPDHAADGNGQGNGNGGNPQMTQGQTAVLRIRRLLIQRLRAAHGRTHPPDARAGRAWKRGGRAGR